MVEATQTRPDQLVSYYDDESSRLIDEWTATGQPVGLYTVVEIPDGHLQDLLAFRLEQLVSTLDYANTLRQKGVHVPGIHVVSPCKIAAFHPAIDSVAQDTNAQLLGGALNRLKDSEYKALTSTEIVIDTGASLTEEARDELYAHAARIVEERPHIIPVSQDLFARNYRGIVDPSTHPVLPVVDLLARTQAWSFSNGSPLFTPRTTNSISYIPPHVSPQIKLMASISRGYPTNPDSQVATVIAPQTYNSWKLWRML